MAFLFKPSLYRGGVLTELPRPVPTVRVQDTWDFAQLKVPLAAGDWLAGHSQQGVDIHIEGQVGTHAGTLKSSEADMFVALESLRSAVHVGDSSSKYEFFLFHDATAGEYRKFKSCSTVRFEFDLSNSHLFTYTLLIHADDPTLYNTPPGS